MSQHRQVMVILPSSRAADRAVLRGISQYARQHGSWSFYWEPGLSEKDWPALDSLELDGVILPDSAKLSEFPDGRIPAIVIGGAQKEVPGRISVTTDDDAIARTGAEHLLACGFRHFAFCAAADMSGTSAAALQLRQERFAEQIAAAGFICQEYSSVHRDRRTLQQQRQDIARWLLSLPGPVGVMAGSDDIGHQVMEACKLAGLRVPEAVGILGVDNDELVCGLGNPALSSVAVNYEHAGGEAAQALDHAMRKRAASAKWIAASPTHVVGRRSTDAVVAQDSHLARALRVIRDRVHAPLPVDEVARAAGLSRRALERRFRAEVGHSILEEIRRRRTDQIARLLVESHLSVGQIAEAMGFPDVQHFARYFRSAKRLSPLAYRRMFGAIASTAAAPQIGERLPQDGVEGRPFLAVS